MERQEIDIGLLVLAFLALALLLAAGPLLIPGLISSIARRPAVVIIGFVLLVALLGLSLAVAVAPVSQHLGG